MSDALSPEPKPGANAGRSAHAGARKAAAKAARSRAREFALQALYQHLVGRNPAADIDRFTRDLSGFHKADSAHYDALPGRIKTGACGLLRGLRGYRAAAKAQHQRRCIAAD